MRFFTPFVSVIVLATGAVAQRLTTTLPYADGDTLVISVSTNALGLPVTTTLSTVAVVGGVTPTTALTTALTTTARTNTRTTATIPTTTTQQRVVGQDTTGPPMRTTTYFYDDGSGGAWTSAVWTASVTAAPTVATAIVPAGTIQNYESYMTVINSKVLASAQQADATNTRTSSASSKMDRNGVVASLSLVAVVAGFMAVVPI